MRQKTGGFRDLDDGESRHFRAFLEAHPRLALRLRKAASVLERGSRDEVRVRVDRDVELILADGTSEPVVLKNLSLGGLRFQGVPASWREGQEVRFKVGAEQRTVQCQGRIAWLRECSAGIAFSGRPGPDKATQQRLRDLLRLS